MNIKYFIKEKIPPKLYNFVKSIYKMKFIPYYWYPYIFMDGKAFHPFSLTLEITFRCNQNCMMCPQSTDKWKDNSRLLKNLKDLDELSSDEIKSLVDESVSLGIKNITITGGEPLLRPDTIEISRYIKSKGITCNLLSNGTLIEEDMAREIVRSGIDKITFSLDGPKDIHEEIRRSNNSFDKLKNAVNLLKKEKVRIHSKTPYISLTCTISALNANRLSETIDVAKDLGVNIHYGYLFYTTKEMEDNTNKIFPIGLSKDEDQNVEESLKQIDTVSLQREINRINEKALDCGMRVSFQPPLKGRDIERRFYDDSFTYTDKCFYPWYAVRVNPYGEVYPCSMGVNMGNIRQKKLNKIWNGDEYTRFRKALKKHKLFPKCNKCCVLNDKLWSYLPRI